MADEQNSHIAEVRRLMLEQLHALRTAPAGEALAQELKRCKGVSVLSATIIDSARVEVEYLRVIEGDGEVPFLAAPEGTGQPALPKPKANPLESGPSVNHPWRSAVHKLQG